MSKDKPPLFKAGDKLRAKSNQGWGDNILIIRELSENQDFNHWAYYSTNGGLWTENYLVRNYRKIEAGIKRKNTDYYS